MDLLLAAGLSQMPLAISLWPGEWSVSPGRELHPGAGRGSAHPVPQGVPLGNQGWWKKGRGNKMLQE